MGATTVKSKQQLTVNSHVSFSDSYRITNLQNPSAAQDAATKAYVDSVKQSLDIKESCRVATTGAETFTISGGAVTSISGLTIDGISLVVNDRILIKNAPSASGSGGGAGVANSSQPANGIYIVTAASTNLTVQRAADANENPGSVSGLNEVTPGMFTFIEEGSTNADNGYVLIADGTITLNTTALTFSQFSGAGQIGAGAGLVKTGNVVDIISASSSRIVVNTDSIDLGQPTITTSATNGLKRIDWDVYGRIAGHQNATFSDVQTTIGSQSTNTVFAAPNGSSGSPTFRLLVGADLIASGTAISVITITGTTNQVTATLTSSTGNVTLSLPQNIHTAATPTFAGITLTGGTVTSNTPIINGTQSWNSSGISFVAELVNITDTTSAVASRFVEYQVGGVAKFSIRKDGAITTGIWNATTIAATYGGTGQTSYAVGDLLYADTTTTLSRLADVATGNVLISGGVNTAPSWGKVGLTTHVSGTLGVTNGGTGVSSTPTAGQLLIGNGSGFTLSTITAGSNITITNSAGGITISTSSSSLFTSANIVIREVPSGLINGSNATFTLAYTPVSGTEEIYVNGVLQNIGSGNDYTISGATITFNSSAPDTRPQSGDVILVNYIK